MHTVSAAVVHIIVHSGYSCTSYICIYHRYLRFSFASCRVPSDDVRSLFISPIGLWELPLPTLGTLGSSSSPSLTVTTVSLCILAIIIMLSSSCRRFVQHSLLRRSPVQVYVGFFVCWRRPSCHDIPTFSVTITNPFFPSSKRIRYSYIYTFTPS
jgi:hypothetical protein